MRDRAATALNIDRQLSLYSLFRAVFTWVLIPGRFVRSVTGVGLFISFLGFGFDGLVLAGSGERPFRLSFSSNVFVGAKEADFRAAMKVWITSLAKDLDIPVDPNIHVQHTVADMAEFSRTQEVDGFVLTTLELAELMGEFTFDQVTVGDRGGQHGEQYLLLVHRDTEIERLEQLQGSEIDVFDHPRMSLAVTWLDTVLIEAGLDPSMEFFSNLDYNTQASQIVLPVFFKTRKACVFTRNGFEVMAELNPQLNQQLQVIAVSSPLIPHVFAFRADRVSPFREHFIRAIQRLDEHEAGRQILTLNQTDGIRVHPISIMDDTLSLISKHHRLNARNMKTTSNPSFWSKEE
jgi:phosphonate transport system substrate-binding protein